MQAAPPSVLFPGKAPATRRQPPRRIVSWLSRRKAAICPKAVRFASSSSEIPELPEPPCSLYPVLMSKLSHYDSAGQARMVDVSGKPATAREARASAFVALSREVLDALPQN